jgi:peptide/nickel transport system permease protein
MTEFIVKRLLISLPLLVAVTALIFVLLQFTPGDPLDAYIPPDQQLSVQQREAIREQLGLDKPPVVRYVYWLGQAARLDLGFRYKNQEPVAREIGRRVGPTLMLMGSGIGLGVLFGIVFGVIAAVRRYTVIDGVLTIGAFLGISTPAFLAGLVGMYLFSLKLKVFPAGGYSTPGSGSTADILYHLALPALILSLFYIASIMRYTRSSVLEVVSQDYVRTARSKGLAEFRVTSKHVLRNALIPVVTVVGANVANLIGGAVFLESIYSWPGMGQLFLDGVESRDYPLIMGLTLILAAVILIANLVTDVLYGLIDPRIRYG